MQNIVVHTIGRNCFSIVPSFGCGKDDCPKNKEKKNKGGWNSSSSGAYGYDRKNSYNDLEPKSTREEEARRGTRLWNSVKGLGCSACNRARFNKMQARVRNGARSIYGRVVGKSVYEMQKDSEIEVEVDHDEEEVDQHREEPDTDDFNQKKEKWTWTEFENENEEMRVDRGYDGEKSFKKLFTL